MNTESNDARAELDRLQQDLSSRQSTPCFAQAAISLVVALIFSGAAAKLFWDSLRTPMIGFAAAALALGLAAFGVLRYRKGKAILQGELTRYERAKALRRELRLDDPRSLLPDA